MLIPSSLQVPAASKNTNDRGPVHLDLFLFFHPQKTSLWCKGAVRYFKDNQ